MSERLDCESKTPAHPTCLERGVIALPGRGQVELTTRERELLCYLRARRGTVGREEILQDVWDYAESVSSRAVDTTVNRLRRKLGESCPVLTVHGEGYRWVARGAFEDGEYARAGQDPESDDSCVIQLADRRVELHRMRVVRVDGSTFELRPTESAVLQMLMGRGASGRSSDGLLGGLGWPRSRRPGLAKLVHQLRRKLEFDPSHPRALLTLRDGYALVSTQARTAPSFVWSALGMVGPSLGLEDCVVYLGDPRSGYRQVAGWGPKSPERGALVAPLTLRPGQGIVGSAALAGEVVHVEHAGQDPRYVRDCFGGGGSEIAIPLRVRGEVVGVLDSEHPHVGFYGRAECRGLRSLARVIEDGLMDLRQAAERARFFL
jgi:DNA-binding response OmpR family regulator